MVNIHEQEVGGDPSDIYFPNVSSCMTVTVVLNDGTLLGTHLARGTEEGRINVLLAELAEMARANGSGIRAVLFAGTAGDWQGHHASGPAFHWQNISQTVTDRLGAPPGTLIRRYDTQETAGDAHVRVSTSNQLITLKVHPATDFRKDDVDPTAGPAPVGGLPPSGERAAVVRRQIRTGPASFTHVYGENPLTSRQTLTRVHRVGFLSKLFGPGKTRRFRR